MKLIANGKLFSGVDLPLCASAMEGLITYVQKVLALAGAGLMLLACSSEIPSEDAKARLVGKYDLIIGRNQNVSRTDLKAARMVLSPDGTYVQECDFKDGKSEEVRGEWSYASKRILFTRFTDCIGVWPANTSGKDLAASLLVEMDRLPAILLSPDTSVHYRLVAQ